MFKKFINRIDHLARLDHESDAPMPVETKKTVISVPGMVVGGNPNRPVVRTSTRTSFARPL